MHDRRVVHGQTGRLGAGRRTQGGERNLKSKVVRRPKRSLACGTRSGANHLLTYTEQRESAQCATFNGDGRSQGGTKRLTCCICAIYDAG